MDKEPTSKNNDVQDDAKEAIAALLSGCTGTTQKEARRRLDWFVAAGSDDQRKQLAEALTALQKVMPKTTDLYAQHIALRYVGRFLAFSRYLRGRGRLLFARRAPGQCMLRIASIFFSKKKVERVFMPLVADYLQELDEAQQESFLKVLLVKSAWWYRFAKACGLDVVLDLAGRIVKACLGL